jgi:DNA-directed RNA polymerase I, II, and III subunit RPABC5
MIIPIRCYTCSKVLADLYRYYLEQVRKRKLAEGLNVDKVIYLTNDNFEKTIEGQVLDEIGLKNVCCRRHFLSHVDIE